MKNNLLHKSTYTHTHTPFSLTHTHIHTHTHTHAHTCTQTQHTHLVILSDNMPCLILNISERACVCLHDHMIDFHVFHPDLQPISSATFPRQCSHGSFSNVVFSGIARNPCARNSVCPPICRPFLPHSQQAFLLLFSFFLRSDPCTRIARVCEILRTHC